jgi:hypothetical protein
MAQPRADQVVPGLLDVVMEAVGVLAALGVFTFLRRRV